MVGLEPDQQIRARRGEDVSELDRPEAAVGEDQVAGTGGAGQRVSEAALAVTVAAETGIECSMRSDHGKDHRPGLGNPKGTPPVVEGPSKGCHRCSSSPGDRTECRPGPGAADLATMHRAWPWWRAGRHLAEHGLSTSSPSRTRARHNDDRFTRERARLPGVPLVSTRSTSSYDSRASRHRARTKYTTSLAGRRRRRRSARSCLAIAASTSSAVNTFVRIPIRTRWPAPHPVTPGATSSASQKQLHRPGRAPRNAPPGRRRADSSATCTGFGQQPAGRPSGRARGAGAVAQGGGAGLEAAGSGGTGRGWQDLGRRGAAAPARVAGLKATGQARGGGKPRHRPGVAGARGQQPPRQREAAAPAGGRQAPRQQPPRPRPAGG